MIYRVLAIVFVAGVGLNELFHAIGGLPRYSESVQFIQPVLTMETTREPDSWHAIRSPVGAHLASTAIILTHLVGGLLALFGAYRLVLARGSPADVFHQAKFYAVFGVGLGAVLYLVGFETFASGWFLLWQSQTHNVIAEAERLFLSYMAVLLFLYWVRE